MNDMIKDGEGNDNMIKDDDKNMTISGGEQTMAPAASSKDEVDDDQKLLQVVKDCENNRFARKLQDYAKLMKTFNAGWTRLCGVTDGGNINVSYKSPDGHTLSRLQLVQKHLKKKEDFSLTKENFCFDQKFLGFEAENEVVFISKSYTGKIKDRESPEDPPQHGRFIYLRSGQVAAVQCLLCSKIFQTKYQVSIFRQHVRENHNPPKHTCPKCKKRFRRKNQLGIHMSIVNCNKRQEPPRKRSKLEDIKEETNLKMPDQFTEDAKDNNRKVKEEEKTESSALLVIDSPIKNGFIRYQMKVKRSREIGRTLSKLLKGSVYEPSQVEWKCEGSVLTGSETVGSVENKVIEGKVDPDLLF